MKTGRRFEDYMTYRTSEMLDGRQLLKVVYVGGFKGLKYSGKGRMYLLNTEVNVLGVKMLVCDRSLWFESE